jgi:hypothetical protein
MAEMYDATYAEDVAALVDLGAEAGLSWTPQRAFRAWSHHSEERFADWLSLSGGDHARTLEALKAAERDVAAEDALIPERRPALAGMVASVSDDEGFGLTAEEAVATWADRCAWEGVDWEGADAAKVRAALAPHARPASPTP